MIRVYRLQAYPTYVNNDGTGLGSSKYELEVRLDGRLLEVKGDWSLGNVIMYHAGFLAACKYESGAGVELYQHTATKRAHLTGDRTCQTCISSPNAREKFNAAT